MPTKLLIALIALILSVATYAEPLADPIAITTGPITGTVVDGMHCYKGIPYAQPPVGALRWRAPQPPTAWTAPRAMTTYGSICPQGEDPLGRNEPAESQSEDCLYLNVWTPARDTTAKLPVMVWVHGGGLVNGSGSKRIYDGMQLAKHGIVLVTFNYRLGPFGFFVHPDLAKESADGSAGNYGLLDQIAALRWVKNNIVRFGGDPNNVTIFGESAGALSVLTLMTALPAQGLFHRAIAQSGAAPAHVQTRAQAENFWQGKAQQIGVTDWTHGLAALRAKPAADILTMYSGIGAMPGTSGQDMLCLDGAVLKQSPAEVFAAGHESAVPLLVGSNTDEGTIFARKSAPTTQAMYLTTLRRIAPGQVDAILARYPAQTDADVKRAYTAALGDASFTATARRTARWHATAGFPTYRYVFGRVTRLANVMGLGAFHGSEIAYVFGNTDGMMYRADDRALSTAMSDCWVAFASTGTPNRTDWSRYAPPHDAYMYFDTTIAIKDGFRTAECDLWDTLAAQHK